MAYGDATLQEPPVPWEEFEYTEYLFRLESLTEELVMAHGRAGQAERLRRTMTELVGHHEREARRLLKGKS